MFAARVVPGCKNRGHAHQEHPPGGRQDRQQEPRKAGNAKTGEGCPFDLFGWDEPAGGQSHRAHAVVVGAANAVGIVIRVVRADLQSQSHNEGQQRLEQKHPPVDVVVDRGVH